MKEVWTEGHQQSEPAGHRQGLKEWHRLHGEEARLRTARRTGETEGKAAFVSNQKRKCLTIRKQPLLFWSPLKFKAEQSFSMGLSVGWAIDREARKLNQATGAKRQSWAEPEERSDKVERSANARVTPGWTARSEATKLSRARGAKRQSWAERECPSNAGLDS